jgi:hypothetical protein
VRIENNTEKQLEENVEENMHPERFSAEFGVQRIFFVLPQELNSTMVRREACSAILLQQVL